MIMKRRSFLLSTLALAACGGGGGSPPPAEKKMTNNVRIEMYGDSTTLGLQTYNGVLAQSANSAPTVLQHMMAALASTITVANEGVGGTEAWHLLTGSDNVHPAWAQQMSQSHANIVTLNFLINDQWLFDHPSGGAWQESGADYINFMTQLIVCAQNAGKRVVLMEPNPVDRGHSARFDEYLGYLRHLAMNNNVLLVAQTDYIRAIPNWESMMSEDGVHPGDALYRIKAQRDFAVLAPIVQELL